MFLLLTRVLLWLLIGTIVYFVLVQFIPRQYFTWIGGLIVFGLLVAAFLRPYNPVVYSLWNVFSFPLKPLGFSLLLLLFAARTIDNGGIKSPGGWQVLIALIVLLVSSTPFLAYQLVGQLEKEVQQIEQQRQEVCQSECPPGERTKFKTVTAIVILGPLASEANFPFDDTGDRLLNAIALYQEQLSARNRPLLIVTGVASANLNPASNNKTNGNNNDIQTLLARTSIPPNKIRLAPSAIDLRSSAIAVEDILKQENINSRRIFLLSAPLHSRRAALTFINQGFTVLSPSPNISVSLLGGTPRRRLQIAEFIPTAEALFLTSRVLDEYYASLYYFLRGWLTPILL